MEMHGKRVKRRSEKREKRTMSKITEESHGKYAQRRSEKRGKRMMSKRTEERP